jgi:hypothetical protein
VTGARKSLAVLSYHPRRLSVHNIPPLMHYTKLNASKSGQKTVDKLNKAARINLAARGFVFLQTCSII